LERAVNEREKQRLRAIQDAILAEPEPQTEDDLQALFCRMMDAATGKAPDPEQEKKRALAKALEKWRR
jgi:hypothetical protein